MTFRRRLARTLRRVAVLARQAAEHLDPPPRPVTTTEIDPTDPLVQVELDIARDALRHALGGYRRPRAQA